MVDIKVLDGLRNRRQKDTMQTILQNIVSEVKKDDTLVKPNGRKLHLNCDPDDMRFAEVSDDMYKHKTFAVFSTPQELSRTAHWDEGYFIATPSVIQSNSPDEVSVFCQDGERSSLRFAHIESVVSERREELAEILKQKYSAKNILHNRFVIFHTTFKHDGHSSNLTVLFDRQNVDKIRRVTWLTRDADGNVSSKEAYYIEAAIYMIDRTGRNSCGYSKSQLLKYYAKILGLSDGTEEAKMAEFSKYQLLVNVIRRRQQLHDNFVQAYLRIKL